MFEVGTYSGVSLQDAISFEGVRVVVFHDFSLVILVFILCIVGGMFWMIVEGGYNYAVVGYSSSNYLEFSWTMLPVVVLAVLRLPSLMLIYIMERSFSSDLTFKSIGHQWY